MLVVKLHIQAARLSLVHPLLGQPPKLLENLAAYKVMSFFESDLVSRISTSLDCPSSWPCDGRLCRRWHKRIGRIEEDGVAQQGA